LIDHVLTSPPLNVAKCCQAVGLSDHRSKIVDIVVRIVPWQITVHSFHKYSWHDVKEALHTAPWQVMEAYDDVTDMWKFISISYNCLHGYIRMHSFILLPQCVPSVIHCG